MFSEALRLYGLRCELYPHGGTDPACGGSVLLLPPTAAEAAGASPRGELHRGYAMLCSPCLAAQMPDDGYAVIDGRRFELGQREDYTFAGLSLCRVVLTRICG